MIFRNQKGKSGVRKLTDNKYFIYVLCSTDCNKWRMDVLN